MKIPQKKGNKLLYGSSDFLQIFGTGRSYYAEHFCNLNFISICYHFQYIRLKVTKNQKFYGKRAITPKRVIGFSSKLEGR